MWNVIYVHFYNWDRPLDLVSVMYDLIELIIETSLWTNNYSTFDTHTQHTRLLFNKCLFHLCDCTCSNVMYILSCLSIKSKNIFEYFICFWSVFMLSCFEFCSNCIFMIFIKNSFKGIFARSSRLSSSCKNGLRQNMKSQNSDRNFCYCLATISQVKFSSEKFCASEAFFTSNFARS